MDDRTALIEEEKLAYDTPLDARIHTSVLPPHTDQELKAEAERVYLEGKGVFKDLQEAEYFSMLPLSKEDRMKILTRTLEIQREEKAAKATWQQPESKK